MEEKKLLRTLLNSDSDSDLSPQLTKSQKNRLKKLMLPANNSATKYYYSKIINIDTLFLSHAFNIYLKKMGFYRLKCIHKYVSVLK